MTSKKKVAVLIAKIILLALFLIHIGFFSLFDASRNNEHVNKEKAKLETANNNFNGLAEKLIEEQASIEEMQIAAENHKKELLEIKSHRAEFSAMLNKAGVGGIISWLIQAYLFLLPWFAGLFLIWFFEEMDENKKFLGNPLSLVISIIIYPIVTLYVADRWLGSLQREMYEYEAVRRAKQKFFNMLSDDDIERMKCFIRDYLYEILEIRNTQPSGRNYAVVICRYHDGFIMEIDHVPNCYRLKVS